MKRCALLVFVTSTLAVTALWGQDRPRGDDPPALKPAGEKPGVKPDGKTPEVDKFKDQVKELKARVARGMDESGKRLGNKDPRDATQQIQRDVVKDIDALIELLKNPPEPPQQGGGENHDEKGSLKRQDDPQGGNKPKGDGEEGGAPKARNKPKQGDSKEADGKDVGAGDKDKLGQAKGSGQPMQAAQAKQPSQTEETRLGRAKDAGDAKNFIAERYREIWGHLPEARRMEMETYSRERFLSKYAGLLEQYYRTIAEQNRRSGN